MFPLLLDFLQIAIQTIEPAFPEPTEGADPRLELLEWGRAQLVDTLLRMGTHLDDSRLPEHPQMLGYQRLGKVQTLDHLVDGSGPLTQHLDDA